MAVVSFCHSGFTPSLQLRDEFVVKPLPHLENDTEAIWAKVLLPGEKSSLEGVLESIIDKPDNKHLILGGDFNCPSIDSQNLSVRPGGAENNLYKQAVYPKTGGMQMYRQYSKKGTDTKPKTTGLFL